MEAGGTSDRKTPEERRRQPESFKRRAEGTDEETGRPDCVQAEMPDCGQSAMSGSGRAEPPEKSGGEAGQGKVLAFDTSNYTTSVALTDLSGYILADERELLSVKKGERGLRQSHALFQHVENLPRLLDRALQQAGRDGIRAVAFSERPRPVEGSYMPVFRAGADFAAGIAAALGVPAYGFSHQEGHIAAVCGALDEGERSVSFHLSGGTGEILLVQGCRPVEIIGGVKDLSFGQLIDRVGVALGHSFPAGAALDEIACSAVPEGGFTYSSRGNTCIENPLTGSISVKSTYVNLSGIETQLMRALSAAPSVSGAEKPLREAGKPAGEAEKSVRQTERTEQGAAKPVRQTERPEQGAAKPVRQTEKPEQEVGSREKRIVLELFCRVADALVKLSCSALKAAETDRIVFVGGVTASRFLRSELERRLSSHGYRAIFGEPRLSSDNACGTARLGAACLRAARLGDD